MIPLANRTLPIALKLIGLGLFVLILSRIDIAVVVDAYRRLDLLLVTGVVVLFYPTIWIKSIRWRRLLPVSGQRLSPWELFRAYLASYFAGTVTPGRLGELSRIGYLRTHDVPMWESAFSMVADRALDVAAIGLLAILGTTVLIDGWGPWIFAVSAGTGILGAGAVWVWRLDRLPDVVRRFFPWTWAQRIHETTDAFVEGIRHNRSIVIPAAGWTIFGWFLCCIQVLLMASALNIEADAMHLIGAYSLAAIVGALPVTVAGVGTRDAALVLTFGLAGLSAESAVAFSSGILGLYVLQGLLCMPFWLHVPSRQLEEPIAAAAGSEA